MLLVITPTTAKKQKEIEEEIYNRICFIISRAVLALLFIFAFRDYRFRPYDEI